MATSMLPNNDMKPPLIPALPNAGVQIKKTRAPPPVKRAATPVSGPVSPITSNGPPKSPAPFVTGAPIASQQEPLMDAALPIVNQAATSDVDALTTGMKKVTLKVGTRKDHDRKQKEKQDAANKSRALKAAETRRLNAAAKKAAAAASTAAGAARPASSSVAAPALTPAQRARIGPTARTNNSDRTAMPVPAVTTNTSNGAPTFEDQSSATSPMPPSVETLIEPGSPAPPQAPTFDAAPLAPAHERLPVEPQVMAPVQQVLPVTEQPLKHSRRQTAILCSSFWRLLHRRRFCRRVSRRL